ncbi:MAG: MMPL family transporter [Candidatus Latescibacteria bacterium]|nr:MMPL family transporter [Candidatus Latescibacterota bacterium]
MRINYTRLVHYIYHHHIAIVLLAFLVSGFTGYYAAQLRKNVKTDLADLLPDHHPSVREMHRIQDRIGGIGPLRVIVSSDSLQHAVDFMLVLADSLEQSPLISSVSRGKNREFRRRNSLLYMDRADLDTIYTRLRDRIDLEKEKQSPFYFALDEEEETELDFSDIEAKYSNGETTELEKHYYLTNEKNAVILQLYPVGAVTDVKFGKKLLDEIERKIAAIGPENFDPSIRYIFKGSHKNSANQYDIIMQDLKSTAVYAIVGVLALIALYFRQVLAAFFVALPLLMSLSWTFGVTYWVIGNLNQITVGLFAILFGLGIDFGIHIFARYREARRRGLDVEKALDETVCHTGSALTTTAVTTAVAFYSLLATDFKGFSDFGFIIGTGILFSLVGMVVICPAFIVVSERLNLLRFNRGAVPAHLLRRGRYPLPWATIGLALVATAFSIYHVSDLEFEYDFSKLKPAKPAEQGQPSQSLPETLREDQSPAIVLTESYEDAREVVETVRSLKAANGEASTIRSVKSVYSALPKDQTDKLALISRIKGLVDDADGLLDQEQRSRLDSLRPYLEVKRLSLEDLPEEVTKKFSSKNGELLNFVMINASVPLKDGRQALAFAEEVERIDTPSGKSYNPSSAHIIFAAMLKVMLADGRVAIVLTLLVVTIVLFIDLRSFVDTMLVLTPLLTALIWVTGFMYLLNIRLNLYNIVAFPTLIGMGIDNGVHVFHRYRELGPVSLRLVLRTTGMALFATSLTTMVGFSGLVPANHPALSSIGILCLIGLFCCFVTSVTLLPALLQAREKSAARQGN